MSDKNNIRSEKLSGVGCDVVSCKYHGGDDCCHAECINIQSQNAIRKAETFCGTFSPNRTETF